MPMRVVSFLFAFIAYPASGIAAVLVVDTLTEGTGTDGLCDIREAVEAADTATLNECGAGSRFDDVVILPEGTIELTGGPLVVSAGIRIQGQGIDVSVLDASGNSGDRHILTDEGGLELRELTLKGAGNSTVGGGVEVSDFAYASFRFVAFRDNTSSGDGGALRVLSGSVWIESCVFENNAADGFGGALHQAGDSILRMYRTQVSGNTASGDGGGISLNSVDARIWESVIANNVADGNGGGLNVFNASSTVSLVNTTIANNSAASNVGGVRAGTDAQIYLSHVTIANNTAGSVAGGFAGIAAWAVQNTIVSGNSEPQCSIDTTTSPLLRQVSNNVLDGLCSIITDGENGNVVGNPGLGMLADNGGPTQTMAISGDSIAARAGTCVGLDEERIVDQRGAPRPYEGCSVGAYEPSREFVLQFGDEAPGVHCSEGGTRFESGLDDGSDGGVPEDGVLQPGEIDSVTYACNGETGPQGPAGEDGGCNGAHAGPLGLIGFGLWQLAARRRKKNGLVYSARCSAELIA